MVYYQKSFVHSCNSAMVNHQNFCAFPAASPWSPLFFNTGLNVLAVINEKISSHFCSVHTWLWRNTVHKIAKMRRREVFFRFPLLSGDSEFRRHPCTVAESVENWKCLNADLAWNFYHGQWFLMKNFDSRSTPITLFARWVLGQYYTELSTPPTSREAAGGHP